MTTCEDVRGLLSAWVDGDLQAEIRDRVREHLAGCAACRRLADDLGAVRDAARQLGPIVPPDHIWLEVAGQVQLDTGAPAAAPRRSKSGGTFQWLGLAAALILVTLGIWLVGRPVPDAPPTEVREASPADVVAAELDLAAEHYERAIATLESMATAGELPVEPAITATLRDNLGVIDRAIDESRQALAENPDSQPARDSLFDALRQKVGLLQATVLLMNEIRRDEPASAPNGAGRSS
jgi:hypothetical protein